MKNNQVAFAIGTGRCGTKFIAELLKLEPKVASVHERNPLNETFHRYCKWYNLPVDNEGFLYQKQLEINQDFKTYNISFESSAYLSFSIQELYERFNAKFILMIRHPIDVINSYLKKGWYSNDFIIKDTNKAIGYQQNDLFHHFLGRTTPQGNYFKEWNKMTRTGKLAWFWKTLNLSILEQFEKLPEQNRRVQKLEDFNYDNYKEIAKFVGYKHKVTKREFLKLSSSKPNTLNIKSKYNDWSEIEKEEYKNQIRTSIKVFNYNLLNE